MSAFRIILSIWLAAAHSFHTFSITDPFALWMKRTSFIATDVFIVMSATALCLRYTNGVALSGPSWSDFMLRRLSRIWPVHALVLVAMAVVGLISMDPGQTGDLPAQIQSWLSQIALIQAWGTDSDWTLWNSPTWTLSALVICYAIYPFICRFTAWVQRPRAVFIAALTLYGVVWAVADSRGQLGFGGLLALPQQVGALRAVPIFILAVLAAPLVGRFALVPKSRTLDNLAANSFCVYVIHWPILKAMEMFGLQGWTYPAAALLIIFGAAHLLRTRIDDPIQRVLKRLLAGEKLTAPVVVAAMRGTR